LRRRRHVPIDQGLRFMNLGQGRENHANRILRVTDNDLGWTNTAHRERRFT
jgi:hypothetical protein